VDVTRLANVTDEPSAPFGLNGVAHEFNLLMWRLMASENSVAQKLCSNKLLDAPHPLR
jgi:hypothetical protein